MVDRSPPPAGLQADPHLRDLLLCYFLDNATGDELSDWLRQLGQDARGTIREKMERVRVHTKYLGMPPGDFPAQTEIYLKPYQTEELAEICNVLGILEAGNKDSRYRRIMREIHYREGWLQRMAQPLEPSALTAAMVAPFLAWFPLSVRGDYEKDFYPVIHDELSEAFGSMVYEQITVAHGGTLKIDFHIGDPRGHGVGVEVKMPTNNGDVQRAIGQLDQYRTRYNADLVLFVLQDFLKPEALDFFLDALKCKGVATVVR